MRLPSSVCSCAAVYCLLAVAFSGCSGGKPPLPSTTPVTGTVTYNGQPLEGASVVFVPKDVTAGKTASATTDAQGKFELTTFVAGTTQAKGAMPGDYKVTVGKSEAGPAMTMPEYGKATAPSAPSVGAKEGGATPPKSAIPERYADPDKSQLTATVKPSANEPFTFALTEK